MSCRPSDPFPGAAALILSAACILVLAGCESLNPYESTHLCEGHAGYGRCATVREAYDESLGGAAPAPLDETAPQADAEAPLAALGGATVQPAPAATASAGRSLYQEALYREMAGLIRRPATPMLAPARTVRALVFPYRTAEGASLYMPRHIYMIVEPPRFLLGDHLLRPGEGDDRSAEELR